jgi:tRNA (uracil-5-)-methyltransferase
MDEQTLRALLGEQAAAEPGLRHVVCQVDSYQALLESKVARASAVLEEAAALAPPPSPPDAASAPRPTLEVHGSQPSHFRQRVDLWVRSDVNEALPGSVLYYAMAPTTAKEPGSAGASSAAAKAKGVRLNGFPAASLRVNALMDGLMQALNSAPAGSTLRSKLYEARFLTSLRGTGPPLVTLIYHRALDAAWEDAAGALAAALRCSIVGRSRGQKVVIGQDWVDEELQLRTEHDGSALVDASRQPFYYRHAENGFTQPNAAVNERMLEFALSCCSTGRTLAGSSSDGTAAPPPLQFKESDLLELYCGNANFTVPLSRKFRSVLATELAGPSVELARDNLRANGCCGNATVIRASADEVARAMQAGQLEELVNARTVQETQQAQDQSQAADSTAASTAAAAVAPPVVLPELCRLRTLLVDPPRSGLDATVIDMARRFFRYVIYISCNPTTMLRDINALAGLAAGPDTDGRQIQIRPIRFATFDQFPYTEHLECGALLELLPATADRGGSSSDDSVGRTDMIPLPVVAPEPEPEPEPGPGMDECGPVDAIECDKHGRTPLHLAASRGGGPTDIALVQALVAADSRAAFIDAVDRDGCSALMRACEPGYLAVVEVLLAVGATTELRDKWGRTALHCAALKGRTTVAALLLRMGDAAASTTGAADGSGVRQGKGSDHRSAATTLATSVDKHSRSALHYAAFTAQGSAELIALLIECQADLEQRDEYAQTPLARAVSSGRVVAVGALIAAGSDLSAVDKHGRTALHCAASAKNVAVVSALLLRAPGQGERRSPVDENGGAETETGGCHDRNGSDSHNPRDQCTRQQVVNQRDRNGRTALFAAAAATGGGKGGGKSRGKGGSSTAAEEIVSLLIQNGAEINLADSTGASPLCTAASKGALGVVSTLMEAGAEMQIRLRIDAQDTDGCTALHHAALHGHREVADVLLAGGADGSILSANGVAYSQVFVTRS